MALVGVQMALSELEMALAGVVYPQQGKEGRESVPDGAQGNVTMCELCLDPPG